MEAYTGFAAVYDRFMDNVPYAEWAEYMRELLEGYGIRDGLVLELGCGTGTMTELLAGYGYDMIGVDCSEEMLDAAMEKREASGHEILYLLQDMREFELYGTVRAVVSVCDSINYLTSEEDLLAVFRLVNNYLDPGGMFIFDINTHYKFCEMMGTQTFSEHREEGSLIWDNYYDEEERLNEYALTIFVRQEQGLYRKYEELHYERCYDPADVVRLLKQAGMQFIRACDSKDRGPVRENSERIYIIAKECQKVRQSESSNP